MSTLFNNKLVQPTDEMLAAALGETKMLFDSIVRFIDVEFGESHIEWKYYGAKLGWSLKVFNNKRNVVFIAPENGHFRVAFVFGEKAYLEIMRSSLPDSIKQQLSASKAYVEGRGLRLEIKNKSDIEPLWQLIRIKLST